MGKRRQGDIGDSKHSAFVEGYRAGHDNALAVDFAELETDRESDRSIDWDGILDWAERALDRQTRIDPRQLSDEQRAVSEERTRQARTLVERIRAKRARIVVKPLIDESIRKMLARGGR
jgi:hypothetical protein